MSKDDLRDVLLPAPESMSIEALVGQLFVLGFEGKGDEGLVFDMVRDWGVGGLLLLSRNFDEAEDLGRLVESIEGAADIPLLWTIDQEGGSVLRITKGGALLPSNMAVTAAGGPEGARLMGEIAGRELADLGIGMDLGPVIDVNDEPANPGIGMRAFGDDPETVALYGRAWVEGLQSTGVQACIKHFPGKGGARKDAHFALPTVDRDGRIMRERELYPFRQLIRAGAASVMSTHVIYPGLSGPGAAPATFDSLIARSILRDELGFDGLLFTDDLLMDAIAAEFPWEEVPLRALKAGHDILLMAHDPDRRAYAHRKVLELVASGAITRSELEEKVRRIFAVKERILVGGASFRSPVDRRPKPHSRNEHDRKVRELVGRAITLHRRGANLPLAAGARAVAIVPGWESTGRPDWAFDREAFAAPIRGRTGFLSFASYDPTDLRPRRNEEVLEAASRNDLAIFFSWNAHLRPDDWELARAVAQRCASMIHVALYNPYDLLLEDVAETAIATFGFRSNVLAELAERLVGAKPFDGRMPVELVPEEPWLRG